MFRIIPFSKPCFLVLHHYFSMSATNRPVTLLSSSILMPLGISSNVISVILGFTLPLANNSYISSISFLVPPLLPTSFACFVISDVTFRVVSSLPIPTRTTLPWKRSEEHTSELQSRIDHVCRHQHENKKYL